MSNRSFFLRGCKAIDKNKRTYQEKAEETKQHSARLAEMQLFVDMTEEKRNCLLDLVLNGKSSDSDESLLEKGVVVYVQRLDVIAQLEKDFKEKGVEVLVIQGSTKQLDRGRIASDFRGNPHSRVVLISDSAGESLSLHSTNELVFYNISAKYGQILGRIARNFGKFEAEGRSFYLHYILAEETLDPYKQILLSTKKQLEEDILHADTINLKGQGSFDGMLLKKVRKDMLWKEKEKRKAKK